MNLAFIMVIKIMEATISYYQNYFNFEQEANRAFL